MANNFFSADGHVAKWVFFPPAWGGEDYWAGGFSEEEKRQFFDHMKECTHCRQAEIEATLEWAELRPRASNAELITIKPELIAPIIDIHNFDFYPSFILDRIVPFIKGKSVHFNRYQDGRIQTITGIVNDSFESSCRFIHADDSVSIHCHCHNREDNLMDEKNRISFTDFNIRLIGNELHCSQNTTDFIPTKESIGREHHQYKITYNSAGLLEKIFDYDELVYLARHDCRNRLVHEDRDGTLTEFTYESDRLISRKVYSTEEILENKQFEYAASGIGPVREFNITESGHHLNSLNTYMDNDKDGFSIDLLHDGVTRRYYNKDGHLLGKILLPDDPAKLGKEPEISHVKKILEVFDTVDMVMVDRESFNIRFIQKCEGKRIVDQTAIYENGFLAKLYNHSESALNTCLLPFFSGRHWTDIIQNNDQIL